MHPGHTVTWDACRPHSWLLHVTTVLFVLNIPCPMQTRHSNGTSSAWSSSKAVPTDCTPQKKLAS